MTTNYKNISDENVVIALKKVHSGSHPKDVANELGYSYASVMEWVRKAGVTFVRRNRPSRNWDSIKEQVFKTE
jgi:hypothetical protein